MTQTAAGSRTWSCGGGGLPVRGLGERGRGGGVGNLRISDVIGNTGIHKLFLAVLHENSLASLKGGCGQCWVRRSRHCRAVVRAKSIAARAAETVTSLPCAFDVHPGRGLYVSKISLKSTRSKVKPKNTTHVCRGPRGPEEKHALFKCPQVRDGTRGAVVAVGAAART